MKILFVLIFVLAFCIHCNQERPTSSNESGQPTRAKKTSLPQNTAAMQGRHDKDLATPTVSGTLKAYIDPETGEFIPQPKGKDPALESHEPSDAISTSSEGLVEVPSPVPGGGTMVNLKGRFRKSLTVTQDGDGKGKIKNQTID